jgi:hypothetical protein
MASTVPEPSGRPPVPAPEKAIRTTVGFSPAWAAIPARDAARSSTLVFMNFISNLLEYVPWRFSAGVYLSVFFAGIRRYLPVSSGICFDGFKIRIGTGPGIP